jgi:hypothetical protein
MVCYDQWDLVVVVWICCKPRHVAWYFDPQGLGCSWSYLRSEARRFDALIFLIFVQVIRLRWRDLLNNKKFVTQSTGLSQHIVLRAVPYVFKNTFMVGRSRGWTIGVLGFDSRWGGEFFSSPQRPERLWFPLSLLSNRYQDSCTGVKAAGAWSWPHISI